MPGEDVAAQIRVSLVEQTLVSDPLEGIGSRVRDQVARVCSISDLRPGSSLAIGCSSRGIANYATIVKAVVDEAKAASLVPFLFPAMGSHGSATAAGQVEVLRTAGITEASMGCEIRSSLDVVELGRLESGMPVAIDRFACEADAFVVINRVKPHTEFTAEFESGLMKMIAIGMGKEHGATIYHRYFLRDGYAATIRAVVAMVLEHRPSMFGVGILEDGFARTADVQAFTAEEMLDGESALLERSKAMVPLLPVDDIDVLVIDEMGKDIAGSGFDTKVVGRLAMPLLAPDPDKPSIKRIVVCDLTAPSQGNADGVGIADFITERLHRKIDTRALYANALAGSEPEHARIPMVLPNDKEAISAAINTIGPVDPKTIRLVHIRNTRDLDHIEVSTALVPELKAVPGIRVANSSHPLEFDDDESLQPVRAVH